MANAEEKEAMIQILERYLGIYYPRPCNYLLVQVPELQELCQQEYGGDVNRFVKDFIEPVASLLQLLRKNNLPITFEDTRNQQTYVLVHLTEPQAHKMTPGELIVWVGRTSPGTLSMRYTRYVTERDGVYLPDPHYEATKMRVPDEDVARCLTRAYFTELRTNFKEKGAERYSLVMRLIVAYNTTTKLWKSLDYDQVLGHRKRRNNPARNPKLRLRSESGVQESGEDPAAKSTEVQELREALAPFHDHCRSQQRTANDEYRSSSPTGTEASPASGNAYNSSSDDSGDENVEQGNGNKQQSLEPEVKLIKQDRAVTPRNAYIEPNEALGANTSGSKEVAPPTAQKTVKDEYL